MFGDLFGQRSTYVEGTFYGGRFKYLKDKNESTIVPPPMFQTLRHRRLQKAKQSNQGKNKEQMKFHMKFQQKRHEDEEVSQKKFRKAAALVRNVVSFEHFSSLNREDWKETVEAGVHLWVNYHTGEVSSECPWRVVEELGGNVEELQQNKKDAATTAVALLTKSKRGSKEYMQMSQKLRQQVKQQRAGSVDAITEPQDRLMLDAEHLDSSNGGSASPAPASAVSQSLALSPNMSSNQLLIMQENERVREQQEKHRRIEEYLASHTLDIPSAFSNNGTRPSSSQMPMLSPEGKKYKYSFMGKGVSGKYQSPYGSFNEKEWTKMMADGASPGSKNSPNTKSRRNFGSASTDISEAQREQRRSIDFMHNNNHQRLYGRVLPPRSAPNSSSRNKLITESVVRLPAVVKKSTSAASPLRPKTSQGRLERGQQQTMNAAAVKAAADRMRQRNESFGDTVDERGRHVEMGTGALVYDGKEIQSLLQDLDAMAMK